MATTPAPLGGERLTPVAAPVETAPLAPAAPRLDSLPRHVAIIMDGNGRWAMTRGLPRIEGHRRGVASVRRTTEHCVRLGIEPHETTDDGKFTLLALECLGSCDTAPVALFNEKLHENLTIAKVDQLIDEAQKGGGGGHH